MVTIKAKAHTDRLRTQCGVAVSFFLLLVVFVFQTGIHYVALAVLGFAL